MTQQNTPKRIGKQSKENSDKTKKAVLKAALHVFAKEGFYNAKLREIADLAGTNHSLIRHHFGSKDDLWRAVVDYGFSLHENRLRGIIDSRSSDDPVSLFKDFIASYISTTAETPEITKMLLHDNSRSSPHAEYLKEKQKSLLEIIEPVFENTQKAGYFQGFDHSSFYVYLRALVETPIATSELASRYLEVDILSDQGIEKHIERVLWFLFH